MKNRFASYYAPSIILVSVVLLLGIVANVRYELVEISVQRHTQYDTVAGERTLDGLVRFGAGFPFQYWRESKFRVDAAAAAFPSGISDSFGDTLTRRFEPLLLAANIAVWILAATLCAVLIRHRTAGQTALPMGQFNRRRIVDDLIVAMAIIIAPLSFVIYHKVRLHHQDALVQQIVQNGLCRTSTAVPKIFADSIPTGLSALPTRIREATLYRPTDEVLAATLDQSSLSGLHLIANQNSKVFARGSWSAPLTELSLQSMNLDSNVAKFIDDNPLLLALHIRNCRFDEISKWSLTRPTELRSVELRGCRIPGEWLTRCRWRKTAENLVLPVGMNSDESLTLSDWPKLTSLQFLQYTSERFPFTSQIRIRQMPNLQSIRLDSLRRYDLVIEDSPQLRILEPIQVNDFESEQISEASRLIRLAQLTLRNCPALKHLGLMISECQKMDIGDAIGLEDLQMGSFRVGRLGMLYREPLPIDEANSLIRQVANLPRLHQLSFTGLPIGECDLQPLADHRQLQTLQFSGTEFRPQQLLQLGHMPRLIDLDIGDCPVDDGAFSTFNQQFPNLEKFVGDLSNLSRLELAAESHLQQIRTPPFERAEALTIEGSSRLETGLNIDAVATHVDLRDVARLSGFSATQPLPLDTKFGRFRDLRYFMVGGANVTDAVLDQLADCRELEQLMLAYSSITRDAWKRVGMFRGLRTLMVPGSPIDDQIIRQWADIGELWNLNLADTQVDIETIRWAMKNRSLRFLSLDRVDLSESAIDQLPMLDQVTHLSLKNIQLSPKQLGLICKIPLDYLDISGQKLTTDHVAQICAAPSPIRIVARNCNLTANLVQQMLRQRPEMTIDLGAATDRILASMSIDDGLDRTRYENRLSEQSLVYSLQDANQHSRYLKAEQARRSERTNSPRADSTTVANFAADSKVADSAVGPTDLATQIAPADPIISAVKTVSLMVTDLSRPGFRLPPAKRPDTGWLDQADLILPPLSYFPPAEWLSGRTGQYIPATPAQDL